MERSADFLRGAKWWADQHTTGYKQLCALLAAAEAREAGERKQSADDRLDEALHHVYAKYGPRLDLFFADVEKAREAGKPTAAEVITAAEKAIGGAQGYVTAFESLHKSAWGDNSMCASAKSDLNNTEDALREALAIIARWKEANGDGSNAR